MASTDLVPYEGMSDAQRQVLVTNQFRPGHDSRREHNGRGRPSRLDDQEYVEQFAAALAAGLDTKDMAELFAIPQRTVRSYKRDPRVVGVAKKLVEDRVLGVVRKTDSEIEARLRNADRMSTKELLEIRKEFLGGAFRQETEGSAEDPDTISSGQRLIENNPALGAKLASFLEEMVHEEQKEAVPA